MGKYVPENMNFKGSMGFQHLENMEKQEVGPNPLVGAGPQRLASSTGGF